MPVQSANESLQDWLDYDGSDQVAARGNQPRPSQPGWLMGDLKAQAPPAVWARYPNKPFIEEFVPPNPPQALGEGKGQTLAWPTSASYHDTPYTIGGDNGQNGQESSSPMQCQSFFRRQMLKQNRERSENGKWKPESESSAHDINAYRDFGQEFGNTFHQRSPSTGTISGDSYHAQSSGASLGKRQRGHIASLPPGYSTQNVMVHVQSSSTGRISSIYRNCDLPDDLPLQLPRLVQPSNPEQLQATLLTLKPMIVYAEFLCPNVCRTRGICVHFSFVLGCKKAPDGLICQVCRTKGNEKAVHAERMCARHNNRKFSSFTMNLAEDILATEAQSVRAHEILARSLTCDWDGVPSRTERKSKLVASSQKLSSMPIRTKLRPAADCNIAVTSIETIPEDEEQAAKRAKANDQNEEAKQDANTYNNKSDAVLVPTTLEDEEQQQFLFGDAHANQFEAFMEDGGYNFHSNESC